MAGPVLTPVQVQESAVLRARAELAYCQRLEKAENDLHQSILKLEPPGEMRGLGKVGAVLSAVRFGPDRWDDRDFLITKAKLVQEGTIEASKVLVEIKEKFDAVAGLLEGDGWKFFANFRREVADGQVAVRSITQSLLKEDPAAPLFMPPVDGVIDEKVLSDRKSAERAFADADAGLRRVRADLAKILSDRYLLSNSSHDDTLARRQRAEATLKEELKKLEALEAAHRGA